MFPGFHLVLATRQGSLGLIGTVHRALGSANGSRRVQIVRCDQSGSRRNLRHASSDPQTDVVPGDTRNRNVRSKNQCSMCPAIHTKSRSWLRSSSTREPSDPLLRVVFLFFSSPETFVPGFRCVREVIGKVRSRRLGRRELRVFPFAFDGCSRSPVLSGGRRAPLMLGSGTPGRRAHGGGGAPVFGDPT